MIAPRRVQDWIGRLLMEVGVDKLLWGSEAALAGGPAPYLKAFMDMEIPEDMRVRLRLPADHARRQAQDPRPELRAADGLDIEAKARELAAAPV